MGILNTARRQTITIEHRVPMTPFPMPLTTPPDTSMYLVIVETDGKGMVVVARDQETRLIEKRNLRVGALWLSARTPGTLY